MDRFEFIKTLRELRIGPRWAAKFLSIDARTAARWFSGEVAVPGPAAQALRAWLRLQRLNLPWHPDGTSVGLDDEAEIADQIARYRRHTLELDEILTKVKARGGSAAPWRVSLARRRAELPGVMEVTFHPFADGGFSPTTYRRMDKPLDRVRDWPLIEDAIASIAEAIAKAGPGWVDSPDDDEPDEE